MASPGYLPRRSFEYERVLFHRSSGAMFATRVTGTRTPWHVFALYPSRLVLEQCRRIPVLTDDMQFPQDLQRLATFPVPPGAHPFLIVRDYQGRTRSFPVGPSAGASPPTSPATPSSEPVPAMTAG